MAGLIKSQILKHLSKFAKNLNAESINVSTLRGEGELKNLELNEQVLTDLLELPTWLRLTRASVNRVSIKIQWTKLKSVPIHLSLDEVVVAMETCEHLRSHAASSTPATQTSSSHYGFADKVVDGLTVTVNSVHVTFRSAVFSAVCQMSRVVLDSRSPGWQRVVDLRMTRLKDPERGFLLLFKELSWQSLRVEATSNTADQQQQLAPLRLLTNASHCRLTIKKKLAGTGCVVMRAVQVLAVLS
ncbi:Vacuolar protein sorting-associated protein 13 N-terminal domain [Trinorchestia longiramus]|nr:Vacuolar protein sorting-associated protein 13 N-terminal domain [Trinorchestia longiramus]